MSSIALMWFRQDLRLEDNPAFYLACQRHDHVIPLYIFDPSNKSLGAAQHWWLHHSLTQLNQSLIDHQSRLVLQRGSALECLIQLIQAHRIEHIYWNRCYEPQNIQRDTEIKSHLKNLGLHVHTDNSALLHEPWTIQTQNGQYYKVFTPFWKACLAQSILPPAYPRPQIRPLPENFSSSTSERLDDWDLLPTKPNWARGFSHHWTPGEQGAQEKLAAFIQHAWANYDSDRDRPDHAGTSRLSPHLHFGEIGPRQIVRVLHQLIPQTSQAQHSLQRYHAELGWREFSYHLLYHFPTLDSVNFKPAFNAFPWHQSDEHLQAWQQGRTGYPIVDAGMRELWQTGYMHNRVRMIVASFLTKDLFIDWRVGASWFNDTLLDADLASNSASWQWVAGCGADAAPYFRIFNPTRQSEKFDPQGQYIQQWIPELKNFPITYLHEPWSAPDVWKNKLIQRHYPPPIVRHDQMKALAMHYYQQLKDQEGTPT